MSHPVPIEIDERVLREAQQAAAGSRADLDGPGFVWLAYYADRSGMAVFDRELDALRYAVEHSMLVTRWTFGTDLAKATR